MFDKKKEKPSFDNRPPQIVDVLAEVFMRTKNKPQMMPSDPRAAAKYWIAHQEPANEFTERTEYVIQGDKSFWKTPYHDRLVANARAFMGMKKIEQVFIIDHIGRGIPWRGDNMEMYKMIVDETLLMQENPQAYIEGALQKMKSFKFRTA